MSTARTRACSRASFGFASLGFVVLVSATAAGALTPVGVPTQAGSQLTIASETDLGAVTSITHGGGGDAGIASAPIPGGARTGTLLWSRHHVDPIYTSCGIAGAGGPVFAGTYLNAPRQVEAIPIDGDGTPDWVSGGTGLFVDASRSGLVLAAIDFDASDSSAVISEWRPGSATPLWSYTVHPCRSLTYQGWASRKPIQVSDDGSTIAVAVTMYVGPDQVGRLFAFEAGSGTPIVDWPFPSGNVVATAISPEGGFVAMAGWPTLYVYDVAGDALRWSGPIGSGNDALAISAAGQYVAWGWTTLSIRTWNGTSYALHHSMSAGASTYVGQVAFSPDDLFAVTWDNGNTTPNAVAVETYDLATPALRWHYDYQGTPPSTHVDIPSSMLFTESGDHLVVGSWGGSFPEVHVFDALDPDPIYTLDTAGSVFDVDVVDASGGGVLVSACGKSVHAGTGGRGGDLYLIAVTPVVAVEPAPPGAGPELVSGPNPFRTGTTMRFTLPAAVHYTLTVHDATGRLLRRFDGASPTGTGTVHWDGRDGSGRAVAPGVYFARFVSGTTERTERLTRAR